MLKKKTQKLEENGNANRTFSIEGDFSSHQFSGRELSLMWNKTQKLDANGNVGGNRELYWLDGWKLRAHEDNTFRIEKDNDPKLIIGANGSIWKGNTRQWQ